MRFLSVLLGALLLASAARAADLEQVPPQPEPLEASEWDVRIQPYVWAAGLSGETKPFARLPAAEVDFRFKDILENLKFAGMVAGSVHRGRFGVAGDLQYVVTQSSSAFPRPAFSRARVSTETFIGTLLADYKAIDDPRGTLYASAGARLYYASTEVTLTPGRLPQLSGTGDDTWVDPIFGVRGLFNITPKIFANGWGYVGGFGAGSDIAADVFGGVGYRFTDTIAANLGYRWLKVDRDTGGFIYDVQQQGLMAGMVISF